MAFFIPVRSEWKIHDVQALLLQHGIKLWGVGYSHGEMYFRVKKRQAQWAQYVMLRAGVPLQGSLFAGSRANPHSPPVSQEDESTRAVSSDLIDWLTNWI